jgi:hypothetical protein
VRRLAKAPSAASTNPSRGLREIAAALVCCLAALAFAVSAQSASAASTVAHPLLSSFDGSATPAGKFTPSIFTRVGIDESAGRVYVGDRTNGGAGVINVFDTSGQYLFRITGQGSEAPGFPAQLPLSGPIAVDNSGTASDGRIYAAVEGSGSYVVYAFDATGKYLSTVSGAATPSGSFVLLIDVAVDDAGNLYVVDAINGAIYKFDSAGGFDSQILTGGTPSGVAVDSNGNLYVSFLSSDRIDKYGPGGNFLSVFNEETPANVAVDRSNDHVYVTTQGLISEFDEGGNLVSRFAVNRPPNPFDAQTVDASTGRIYHISANNWPAGDHIDVYGPGVAATAPDVTIAPATDIGYFEATVNGTIDPLGQASSYRALYRPQGSPGWKTSTPGDAGSGSGAVPATVELTELNSNTTYEVRLVGIDSADEATSISPVETFKTAAVTPPDLTIDPVDEITPTSAHLSGSFDPQDVATTARFEYRTESGEWTSLPSHGPSGGSSPIAIEDDVAGLIPGTTYFVRLVASNRGASAESPELSFTTPGEAPFAYSGGAAPRTETTARINGWVTPRNSPTTYYFEYGPTQSYGTSLPASQDSDSGSGMRQIAVSAELNGLAPGATYHFRLVAENATGKTVGPDREFRTRTAAEAGPRARGIELLNSPEKGNQVARVPEGVIANSDATKILWTTNGGAPGGSTGTGNTFMAQRTAEGWRSTNLLPSADRLIDNGESKYEPKLANPSFDEFLYVISSGILTPPPRKYATLDLGMNQSYLSEVRPANYVSLVRANDDFSHAYANGLTDNGTEQIFDVSTDPPTLASALLDDQAADCGVTSQGDYSEWVGSGYEWVSTDPGAPARVYFESPGEKPCGDSSRLYMRDLDAGTTTVISGPALPGGPQSEGGVFARASADGSRVIFAAESRLTLEDTNNVEDIYRYEVGVGPTCLTCVGAGGAPGVDNSYDRSIVVSRNLSWVYFLSPNLLVPGVGEQGAANIYVWHDGQIDYVASARSVDGEQEQPFFFQRQVIVADGGRTIFFISFDPEITSDDVGKTRQLFRYSATDHSVECVSCMPGVAPGGHVASPWLDIARGIDDAAESGNAVVFQTATAFSSEDVNRGDDVYEWRNGRIGLVTDGVTQYPPGTGGLNLVGIGEDGMNVIFRAGVNLTGYERDDAGQIYVARVGGGFPPPPGKPAPCGEESCQGPLQAPPPISAPGSASVAGHGNAKEEGTPAKPRKRCTAKARKGGKASRAKACGKKKAKSKKKSANRKQGGNR